MKISEHFTFKEYACRCGCQDGSDECPPSSFLDRLEKVRDECNFPFIISSWNRCPVHNEFEGGAKSSMHLHGRAVDIIWVSWTGSQKLNFIQSALSHGFKGIGISRMFIHVDDRAPYLSAIWTYG